jgi:predicted ATPase
MTLRFRGDTPATKRHHCQTPGEGEGVKGRSRLAGARSAALEAVVLTQHHQAALDLAHKQGALSWELRAATSLARLQRDRGRQREAREILSAVYGRFTEGFATADLIAAKQLLDEAGGSARH